MTRFKKAVKKATREVRRRESDVVAVVQDGLESMRTVQAFGRAGHRGGAARRGEPRDGRSRAEARRIKSLLSPVVTIIVALLHGDRSCGGGRR